jgi:hypothetical protein
MGSTGVSPSPPPEEGVEQAAIECAAVGRMDASLKRA